ncbi:hypothetical protein KIW84_073604 [Lathyrus oleraceus]|uniref:Uncharacterized protein n=1 Tax=Pisum sativum TaxID=3888 RepID=A0A9D4ZYV6_PEA|nr:hypothetical protein KIW84_073604 [Pisum sativum]
MKHQPWGITTRRRAGASRGTDVGRGDSRAPRYKLLKRYPLCFVMISFRDSYSTHHHKYQTVSSRRHRTSAKSAANANEVFYEIAKRLPRAQPAQNPAGMVLVDRPAEGSSAASCCSQVILLYLPASLKFLLFSVVFEITNWIRRAMLLPTSQSHANSTFPLAVAARDSNRALFLLQYRYLKQNWKQTMSINLRKAS